MNINIAKKICKRVIRLTKDYCSIREDLMCFSTKDINDIVTYYLTSGYFKEAKEFLHFQDIDDYLLLNLKGYKSILKK